MVAMDALSGFENVGKRCQDCGEVKPLSEFYQLGIGNRGQIRYHSYCNSCLGEKNKANYQKHHSERMAKAAEYRQENRERLREAKRARIEKWKAGRKCEVCGESRIPCLDFHHVDRESKEHEIAHLMSRGASDEEIAAEIAKCIVLCRNCHAWLHWQGGGWGRLVKGSKQTG